MYYNKYLKYQIPKQLIHDILKKYNKTKVNFFFDVQSICKGLYNKDNIFFELNYYIQNNCPSNSLINEMKDYLNSLYMEFKEYSPFMILFYDNGKNSQNTLLCSGYKDGRSSIQDIIQKDDELQLYYEIKKFYFTCMEEKFTKEPFGKVYFLKDYESDLIPYYCIKNNLYNSKENFCLNIVLSTDKDLLQCCQFLNTIQITNRFSSSKLTGDKKFLIDAWDDKNAVSYIYKNFKPDGKITSKHIPLILALAGDSADNVVGLSDIGPKKAIDLIKNNNLPHNLEELQLYDKFPKIIQENLKLIIRNLRITSFEEQIKRTSVLNSCNALYLEDVKSEV